MSDVREIYLAWVDGLNRHDLSVVERFHNENFINHSGAVGSPQGRDYIEFMKQGFIRTWNNIEGYRIDIIQLVVEGDKVAFYQTLNGTHRGEIMGVAGTGNAISVVEAGLVRIVGDQFVERWLLLDRFGLMQQIGGKYPF